MLLLLGLGLSACDREFVFRVEGAVSGGDPVQLLEDIEVRCDLEAGGAPSSAKSDAEGGYSCEVRDLAFAARDTSAAIALSFEDTDGEANGGRFAQLDKVVEVDEAEPHYFNVVLEVEN